MERKLSVYVDGQAGTTGLAIGQRLREHPGVSIRMIDPNLRKDAGARKRMLNSCDVAFLCLPDEAAREAVFMIENTGVVVIDASTAHRTNALWAYGLPELGENYRDALKTSNRIAVPGCHATALILLTRPLVDLKLLQKDYPICATSVTGYSGGGKPMIASYETIGDDPFMNSPRQYALTQAHKHLPEMKTHGGLAFLPSFSPIVGNFYKGMAVSVPLASRLMAGNPSRARVHQALSDFYAGQKFIRVQPLDPDIAFFDATKCNETNRADLFVLGNDERILLIARIDNLGKGASGAAVQCMNIRAGFDEGAGLRAE